MGYVFQHMSSLNLNLTTSATNTSEVTESANWMSYNEFIKKVVVPSLCVVEIIGNIFNLLILSKRMREGKF